MNNNDTNGNNHTASHMLAAAVTAGAAAAACAAEVAAGLGSRLGLWHFRTGFKILTWGGYFAAFAALAALATLAAAARRRRWGATTVAAAALVIGVVGAATPVAWKTKARQAPPIHDITTDVVNPPEFNAILPLRRDAPNPAVYGGTETAVRQRETYPDIRPVVLEMAVPQAFHVASQAVRKLGWEVVAESIEAGMIEAVDTTFWFGFKDDIIIRITAAGPQRSVVDIRSTSRVGIGDAGTNARRIRKFVNLIGG